MKIYKIYKKTRGKNLLSQKSQKVRKGQNITRKAYKKKISTILNISHD